MTEGMIEPTGKEVRYCEHVKSERARPYMRAIGTEYDLVMCWQCQNNSAPYLNKIEELRERLERLTREVAH